MTIVARIEQLHRCSPGVTVVNGRFDIDFFAPAGSVWQCPCDRTWIAYYDTPDVRRVSGFLGARWRREGRWARRRRLRSASRTGA